MINYMFWKVRWINDSTCMLITSYEQPDDLFYHLKDTADYYELSDLFYSISKTPKNHIKRWLI